MIPGYDQTQGRVMLCPSILSADFTALGRSVDQVANLADVLHIDVMDGHFVPNLTIGLPIVAALRAYSPMLLDVHLMVEDPIRWIDDFARAGADTLVIHQEACVHLHRAVQLIHDAGCTAGVAINPATSLQAIEGILPFVDMVLLMTVNPGFGGQAYIPGMLDKVKKLRRMLDDLGRPVHIQVDGGLNVDNIRENVLAGADMIVVGSAVYGSPDPSDALRKLRACVP
jgi:ribulose-phosphate 3-epimerase